eukprot:4945633-Karenia_brevis.AAC.1
MVMMMMMMMQYLGGRPSPLGLLGPSSRGLPGWTSFTAWITWTDDLHCLDYCNGQPFTACFAWSADDG